MSTRTDIDHFVGLRKQLTQIRETAQSTSTELTPLERDVVALASAEALVDIAATLNAGISVNRE